MKTLFVAVCLLFLLPTVNALGGDFQLDNVWMGGNSAYSTGIGWADFDHNGWLDLYSANGFDLVYRSNTIYFNDADSLRRNPGYTSTEQDPSGMISIGDLNDDGYPDVVVSSLSDFNIGAPPYRQVIYFSDGGVIDETFGWSLFGTLGWSNALGDFDGDGDLDVAFALGDRYTSQLFPSCIFENVDGVISAAPVWSQAVASAASDAAFVDIDLDGDLDLALTAGGMADYVGGGAAVYYNDNGVLETTPSWISNNMTGGPQLDFGDLDDDGYPELAVAGGLPLTAGGHVYMFRNYGGVLETEPSWSVPTSTSSSTVAWGDMDGDGDLDLISGSNGDPTMIYRNDNGVLTDSGVYEIDHLAWTTMIALADYDQDYLVDTFTTFTGDGSRHLYSLKQKPIHRIESVEINGTPLDNDQYCYELEKGWVSLGVVPASGDEVRINYQFSRDLDVVLSCWGGANLYENSSRDLSFSYPLGLPNLVKRGYSTEVQVLIEGKMTGTPLPGTGRFHYSLNGEPYTSVAMEVLDENLYRVMIPAVTDCDDELKYYFSAEEFFGRIYFSTDTAVGHTFTVYTSSEIAFEDNFLTNKYWGISGTATEGAWERVIPSADGSDGAPTEDFDGTGYCFLTGSAQGIDVDDGYTYIVSRKFAIPDTATTFVSYACWFDNSCAGVGNDYFSVYLSNDDGDNWTLAQTINGGEPGTDGGWYTYYFVVNDYLTPTAEMKLKFEVADVSPNSCVEAALDDVKVTNFLCSPSCCIGETGNVNCDPGEIVDISDITRLIDFLYISHNPLCCPEEADPNGTGGDSDIADITKLIDYLYLSHQPLSPCS
ncbi:MAG: FG-GAP repeat domain-containing protein [Candidatus Zixiibacteriota bacterium]